MKACVDTKDAASSVRPTAAIFRLSITSPRLFGSPSRPKKRTKSECEVQAFKPVAGSAGWHVILERFQLIDLTTTQLFEEAAMTGWNQPLMQARHVIHVLTKPISKDVRWPAHIEAEKHNVAVAVP